MYDINRSALVPYSDQKMYDLINDVDQYQHFLPWCGQSEIIEASDEIIVASVRIAYKGVHKTFTTRNTLTPFTEIKLALVDGPFKQLAGSWHFKALGEDACRISLHLEFGFENRIVDALIGPVYTLIAKSMLDSFVKRAEELYD